MGTTGDWPLNRTRWESNQSTTNAQDFSFTIENRQNGPLVTLSGSNFLPWTERHLSLLRIYLFIFYVWISSRHSLSLSLSLTRKRRNPNLCRFYSIKLSRNREFVAPISLSREIHFAEKLRSAAVRVSCEVSETLEIFVFCADIHHFRLNSSIRSVYVFGIFGWNSASVCWTASGFWNRSLVVCFSIFFFFFWWGKLDRWNFGEIICFLQVSSFRLMWKDGKIVLLELCKEIRWNDPICSFKMTDSWRFCGYEP